MLNNMDSISTSDNESEIENNYGIKKTHFLIFTLPGTYYNIATSNRLPIDSFNVFVDAFIIYYNFPLLIF